VDRKKSSMKSPDRIILLSGGVILVLGFLKGILTKQPLTPIMEGGIVLVLFLSLLDAFGNDGLSKFSDAMAILAMIAVLYQDLPPVATVFSSTPNNLVTKQTGGVQN
jgi:amino acid transporter